MTYALHSERDRRVPARAGIRLKPEVLPFSNLAAALPPFILAPQRVLAIQVHRNLSWVFALGIWR